jgi:hypothetical protein
MHRPMVYFVVAEIYDDIETLFNSIKFENRKIIYCTLNLLSFKHEILEFF